MILSIAPRIVFVENVLDKQQCNDLIDKDLEFVNSGVYDQFGNATENTYQRNNLSYRDIDGNLSWLQELAIALAKQNAPYDNFEVVAETVQIQKYSKGQEYKSHCDFSIIPSSENIPRVATVIFYLNENFVDGQTYFDRLQLTVTPATGAALIFYYPKDNINLGILTEHCGKPVAAGTKYIATVWLQCNNIKEMK